METCPEQNDPRFRFRLWLDAVLDRWYLVEFLIPSSSQMVMIET